MSGFNFHMHTGDKALSEASVGLNHWTVGFARYLTCGQWCARNVVAIVEVLEEGDMLLIAMAMSGVPLTRTTHIYFLHLCNLQLKV